MAHTAINVVGVAMPRPSRSPSVALAAVHFLIARLWLVYLLALGAMLFRPPDLQALQIDRIGFGLLIACAAIHLLVTPESRSRLTLPQWPMLGMLFLGSVDLLSHPYHPEGWSVFAAKWIVPVALFCISGVAFRDKTALRALEIFTLAALLYLIVTACLFFFDLKSLIFPSFIVDESIGIHIDRARGPFLQAVANGMSLNFLGLVAWSIYRRRRLPGWIATLLVVGLPIAVLATKTRAVWLSFALSAFLLAEKRGSHAMKSAVRLTAAFVAVALGLYLTFGNSGNEFASRLEEKSPVEFRMSMYRAGLDMLMERPVTGWGFAGMQRELIERIDDFHQREFYFHNTFLEVAVQYGLVGLAVFIWVIMRLFRLVSGGASGELRSIWPVLLVVYCLNACFVVMNYQFVNGYLFTLAGLLHAQNRESLQEGSYAL